MLGLYGILGFVEHLFFSEAVAALIGWPDSPFQYEVAYANLVFGVLGVWAFISFDRRFVLACLVGFTVWFGCDGLGHVYSLVAQGDRAPYNAGSTLYTDLLLPLMGWVLYWFGPPPHRAVPGAPGGGGG